MFSLIDDYILVFGERRMNNTKKKKCRFEKEEPFPALPSLLFDAQSKLVDVILG